jgi:AcrR family transcriptional regulator
MTLFRHFESKAVLFDAAVLDPLRQFIDKQLTERPLGAGGPSTAEKTAEFLGDLLALALNEDDHPLLVVAAELAQPDPGDAVSGLVEETMAVFLHRFEIAFRERAELYEFTTDPTLVTRIMLGSVLSIAHHQRWLLPAGTDRTDLVREMTKLTVWGLAGHPTTGTD